MRIAERLVKFRGGQVAGAEQQIVTPFASVMFNVHKSDAGAGGKIESGHARAVDIDRQIYKRRSVGFLVCRDSECRHALLGEAFVAQPIELTFSGHARELSFKIRQIEWASGG